MDYFLKEFSDEKEYDGLRVVVELNDILFFVYRDESLT